MKKQNKQAHKQQNETKQRTKGRNTTMTQGNKERAQETIKQANTKLN